MKNNAMYLLLRDVNIMIFFGFGFLMTFLRRYGYSAVGYTLLVSAVVIEWSVLVRGFFFTLVNETYFPDKIEVSYPDMIKYGEI